MAGFKTFVDLDILTAAEVNGFLMTQAVMVFDDAAARTAALGAAVSEGMVSYNKDTAQLEYYDGANWEPVVELSLDDLTDVDLGTPDTDDVLQYDGTKWVAAPLPAPTVGASIGLVLALGG